MSKYELLLILPGTLDEKEVEIRAQEVVGLVKELSSDVEMLAMGKNRLAYPVKQIRYGYYYTITFNAEKPKVVEMQRKLNLERGILRFMVSHFNTAATINQKITYSTDSTGVTTMAEKPAEKAVESEVITEEKLAEVPVVKVAKPAEKNEKLDIAAINKKLDDIIGGDVISGV